MYTQQDYNEISTQWRQRWTKLALLMIVPLAVLIWSLIVRMQSLTVGMSILMGCAMLFYYGVSISPIGAYRKHMGELLHGRNREMEGVFKGFEHQYAVRDGVRFLPMMLNVGDPEEPKDDRLLYWDLNLPLPDWQEGEQLWVASFDKSVTDWRRTLRPSEQ